MLGDEEAPHVAQHHQDVLVDRVDVEEVVLHLAHDAAEHPQVAAQHAGLVHQPEGMRLAFGHLQDLHEGVAVDRVAAEVAVHHLAGVVQRAQRACREALDAMRALEDEKRLQDGVRLALVQVVAHHLEHAGAVEKALVDRAHRCVLRAVDALLDVEHQDLVELRHRLGGPVVAAHQHFGHALALGGLVAEALGHGGLQVEHQPVFAPAGHHVQARADQAQQALVALQLLHLEGRDQPLGRELVPALAETRGARHPDHHLQVAQAAGALFAVGLQRVGRVFVLLVALAHLERLGHQKGLRVHRRGVGAAEGVEHLLRAAEVARFEQRGLHRHVVFALGDALVDGAHAGADLQADVPAGGDEAFDRRLERVVG